MKSSAASASGGISSPIGWQDVTKKNVQRPASAPNIKSEGWTLNISRYVLPPIGDKIPPLAEAAEDFKQALSECRAAEDHLRQVLTEGGWLA